jgi:hypothetical protein
MYYINNMWHCLISADEDGKLASAGSAQNKGHIQNDHFVCKPMKIKTAS